VARSRITNSQVLDADFALQSELNSVADNSTGTFDPVTMNNASLLTGVTAVRNKTLVFLNVQPLAVTVPAGQNYTTLTGAAKPGYNIAIGASVLGAITARLAGSVGSNQVTAATDNGNLCNIRSASTYEALATGGCRIYALLQAGSSATDATAFADTGNNLGQVSFVYWNSSAGAWTACPIGDIAGKSIQIFFRRREQTITAPEQAFSQDFLSESESVFGRNYAYASTVGTTQATTGTTFATRLTLTMTVAKAGTFRVGWSTRWQAGSANRVHEVQILHNGATVYDLVSFTSQLTTAQAQPILGFFNLTLTPGTHTFALQFRATTSVTITLKDTHIEAWRVL
jgi:hypothetical protein